jgi:hypothetical protein
MKIYVERIAAAGNVVLKFWYGPQRGVDCVRMIQVCKFGESTTDVSVQNSHDQELMNN